MRKTIAVAFALALIGLAVAAATEDLKPLKVKTGQWQMTETVTWTGLPPQMAAVMKSGVAHQYKSCVKQSDLLKNPWAEGSGHRCTWTVLNSDGTDMEVQGTCDAGGNQGMNLEMRGKIHAADSENGTGSVNVTLSGNGMNAKGHVDYTGKWIGSTCAAGAN